MNVNTNNGNKIYLDVPIQNVTKSRDEKACWTLIEHAAHLRKSARMEALVICTCMFARSDDEKWEFLKVLNDSKSEVHISDCCDDNSEPDVDINSGGATCYAREVRTILDDLDWFDGIAGEILTTTQMHDRIAHEWLCEKIIKVAGIDENGHVEITKCLEIIADKHDSKAHNRKMNAIYKKYYH